MFKCVSILAAILVAASVAAPVAVGAPGLINYQGRLTNSSGVPVNGTVDIEFTFYDAAVGGTQLATPQLIHGVTVTNGVFNVQLTASYKTFVGAPSVYLELEVNGETLAPRQQILTAPYAFGAVYADEAGTAQNAEDADTLDGQHLGDLDSRYVNATTDTMSGSLTVNNSLHVGYDATVERILNVCPDGIGGILVGDIEQFTGNEVIATGGNIRADRQLYLGSSKSGGNIHCKDTAGNEVLSFDAQAGTLTVGASGESGEIELANSAGTTKISLSGYDGDATFTGKVNAEEGIEGQGVSGAPGIYPSPGIPAVPGVRGVGTAGALLYPGAPGVEAVGGGGTMIGSADIAIRSYGKLYMTDHDDYGIYMVPGNGIGDTAGMSIGPYGDTATTPLLKINGDMTFATGDDLRFETGDGSEFYIYGDTSTDVDRLRIGGPSYGELLFDWSNAVIKLGGSTADTVEIPAKIISDTTGVSSATVHAYNNNANGIALYAGVESSDASAVIVNKGTGDIIRGFSGSTGGNLVFRVLSSGRVVTTALQITGGGDLAEPFHVSETHKIKPGMVVAIDPDNPGRLRLSTKPYDRTVAGIVSGANGINPGVMMKQEGTAADGSLPVALTGRVYCWCDASNGAITPGDLLTTASTPGHAMKVTDYTRAQGAIIGKAMTSLKQGRGLVLVLVTLQ